MTATIHTVQVEKTSGDLAREQQLAWKLAELATRAKDAPQDDEAVAMAKNRIIDNAAIALGAANESAVKVARADALASKGAAPIQIRGVAEVGAFDVEDLCAEWPFPVRYGKKRFPLKGRIAYRSAPLRRRARSFPIAPGSRLTMAGGPRLDRFAIIPSFRIAEGLSSWRQP